MQIYQYNRVQSLSRLSRFYYSAFRLLYQEAYDKASLLENGAAFVPPPVSAATITPVEPQPAVKKEEKIVEELIIERAGVKAPTQPVKPKADPMRQSFIDTNPLPVKAEVKNEVEAPKPPAPKVVQPPVAQAEVTPLTEAKGDVEELFAQTEKHMKDGFFEKAIEIYRVILKKEPRNNTVRQKLHQAYLLLAQQEEDIGNRAAAAAPRKDAPKEKKSKISYL